MIAKMVFIQGVVENNVTCTACAGTLLLEFGLLSSLTGDPIYMDLAHRCAKVRTTGMTSHSG